jgi:hypothetical protein
MNFKESSYFSNVRKNDQTKFYIFGKDFSVKNAEKKIQKKTIFQFFSKKNTFLIFLNLIFFSWKTDKLNQKQTKTPKPQNPKTPLNSKFIIIKISM